MDFSGLRGCYFLSRVEILRLRAKTNVTTIIAITRASHCHSERVSSVVVCVWVVVEGKGVEVGVIVVVGVGVGVIWNRGGLVFVGERVGVCVGIGVGVEVGIGVAMGVGVG